MGQTPLSGPPGTSADTGAVGPDIYDPEMQKHMQELSVKF